MLKEYAFVLLLVAWIVQGSLEASNPATRIIGGEDAEEGAFPYQVSLRRTPDLSEHQCGGTLIRPTFVLTAAHCTYGLPANRVRVVVGTNTISSGGTMYTVTKIINHENYNRRTVLNDISLIQTTEISFNSKVAPLPLTNEPTPDGTRSVLTGWGWTKPNRSGKTDKLQVLYVNTFPIQECIDILKKAFPRQPVTTNHVCAFDKNGTGACLYDSGGPLAAGDELIGIVSWGYPCGGGNPDVYTSVYKYLAWILNHIDSA
ncbi:chymotrypsin-1-like [Colias croceus]|uniref:chymotrypsin-1-like n=1 Tax=Colias crocea TaxID=72248 RepID=UPI001E27AF94|nr:chymotrypsin-1-like [Colias croceus]